MLTDRPSAVIAPPPATPDAATLLDAAPVPLVHLSAERRLLCSNAAARALLGDLSRTGTALSELWREDSDASALCRADTTDVQLPLRLPAGPWVQASSRPLPGGGWMLAFVGIAPEVTERTDQARRAEEVARRFELVTQTAGMGYWSLEERSLRSVWSEPLRDLFGLGPQDPVPTLREWLRRHVHDDERAEVRTRFLQWRRSGSESLTLDFRVHQRDGSLRHISTHTRVETGGGLALLFGLVIDLTERRKTEQALRGAAERAALAARGAGLGTWELDLQTGEAIWDEQMWALRGLPARPRAAMESERMGCVHPDDQEQLEQRLQQARTSSDLIEHEFRVVWPDGSVHWLASRSIGLRDAVTGVPRRIGMNWDVTDSRTTEAVRQEREIALGESRAKSKFLARMSHELRTPLNAVLGFSQLLLADEQGTDMAATQRRQRLEHIRGAGQHLLNLINDVLDLSSLEGGELRIALQPVALQALVADTLLLLGPLCGSHQVSLLTGELAATAMADATRLRQVLLNLLTNAVKYNRAGGSVTVEALPRGHEVLLRVSDTGHGMTEEQLRQLFEPFNRLGRDGGATEGTGIGLAIVKALVERMGGSVQVDSKVGVGSVFEVRLAAAGAPPAAAMPATRELAATAVTAVAPRGTAGPRGASATARRVLYIEDNPVNALIISELLTQRGDIELQVAVDGASGVAQAQVLRPDLILLDMQLPDIDGYEVLRQLRARPATAHIPCIALSANAMPEDIERGLRAGLSDYWTKPLDFAAFRAAIGKRFGPAP
jgi:PAS domain S-box-containing protein